MKSSFDRRVDLEIKWREGYLVQNEEDEDECDDIPFENDVVAVEAFGYGGRETRDEEYRDFAKSLFDEDDEVLEPFYKEKKQKILECEDMRSYRWYSEMLRDIHDRVKEKGINSVSRKCQIAMNLRETSCARNGVEDDEKDAKIFIVMASVEDELLRASKAIPDVQYLDVELEGNHECESLSVVLSSTDKVVIVGDNKQEEVPFYSNNEESRDLYRRVSADSDQNPLCSEQESGLNIEDNETGTRRLLRKDCGMVEETCVYVQESEDLVPFVEEMTRADWDKCILRYKGEGAPVKVIVKVYVKLRCGCELDLQEVTKGTMCLSDPDSDQGFESNFRLLGESSSLSKMKREGYISPVRLRAFYIARKFMMCGGDIKLRIKTQLGREKNDMVRSKSSKSNSKPGQRSLRSRLLRRYLKRLVELRYIYDFEQVLPSRLGRGMRRVRRKKKVKEHLSVIGLEERKVNKN